MTTDQTGMRGISRHMVPPEDWDRAPWNRWSFQHVRELVPTVTVRRGTDGPLELSRHAQAIDDVTFACDGGTTTVGAFLEESYTDGFIALHRGRIIAERYMNGMTERTQHLSQSVAKSITGTLAGILVGRGLLDPQAPITEYLPELEATAYRGACVQHVLDMTSGVNFDEEYTSLDSDIAKVDVACGWKTGGQPGWPKSMWQVIRGLTRQECDHGSRFRYRSIETDVLAFILERVGGERLADLVSREIWTPIGAEEDAYFTVDRTGYALADGGFNATLRDYARFGLLHANHGMANGRQIVPYDWIAATRKGDHDKFQGDYRAVLPQGAYKNQFWIEDIAHRAYMARGVFGQIIYIDPDADFVAVKLSSWPEFTSPARTRLALAAINAIKQAAQK
ncbi:MAG TPA: serine hydrolase [Dongiaceae bacterium]|nr:serine hydrolase [Dongiaceae bacterium]